MEKIVWAVYAKYAMVRNICTNCVSMLKLSMQCNVLYLLVILLFSTLSYAQEQPSKINKKSTAINFSSSYKNLSVDHAYQLQKAFVRNRASHGITMLGFKAELNAPANQEKYQVSKPVTSILIKPLLQGDPVVLPYRTAEHFQIKQVLAFKANTTLTKAVPDIDRLKSYFLEVAPAVELPDFNFIVDTFNGLDIIANNAMANQVILGEWFDSNRDLDNIPHSLHCGDKELVRSDKSHIVDGQWQTLFWMVNHLIQQGYRIQPGHILLTGSLDGMFDAEVCDYTADFSDLGQIQFIIQ